MLKKQWCLFGLFLFCFVPGQAMHSTFAHELRLSKVISVHVRQFHSQPSCKATLKKLGQKYQRHIFMTTGSVLGVMSGIAMSNAQLAEPRRELQEIKEEFKKSRK